ncbi:MAG TPA: hypothetical protein VLB07_12805 [Woeseiaceae bacterium]|nr:hypothetical protein [Woeseiaceae bacterium]
MRLADPLVWADAGSRGQLIEHLAGCGDCRDALSALDALHTVRAAPVPQPHRDAIDRIIETATAGRRAGILRPNGFWAGAAAGAAAAGLVAALWLTLTGPGERPDVYIPQVAIASHQPGYVNIGIESAVALRRAEIHVALRGAIDLEGFEGQRDIRWTTDLEPGINELTLPVLTNGQGGGQLIVEVYHGDKLKTFTVDVHALSSGDAA